MCAHGKTGTEKKNTVRTPTVYSIALTFRLFPQRKCDHFSWNWDTVTSRSSRWLLWNWESCCVWIIGALVFEKTPSMPFVSQLKTGTRPKSSEAEHVPRTPVCGITPTQSSTFWQWWQKKNQYTWEQFVVIWSLKCSGLTIRSISSNSRNLGSFRVWHGVKLIGH